MKNKKRYIKRSYEKTNPITVYKRVRRGQLGKFPNNYLSKEVIKEIVRYVFLVELKFNRKDIVEKVDHKFLMKLSMGGFRKFFDMKDYNVLSYSFPEMDIKPWEFIKVEPQFWYDKENQKQFLLWIMEKENIDPNKKEELRKLTSYTIKKYGGARILKIEPDVYTILTSVTGDRFKEWEIMKVRAWNEEKVKEAVKWLIEEKMQYTLEQACNIKVEDFKKYNLDGMLQKACNHSILYALNLTYGNCFIRISPRRMKLKTA